jgi:hypothetical protein
MRNSKLVINFCSDTAQSSDTGGNVGGRGDVLHPFKPQTREEFAVI